MKLERRYADLTDIEGRTLSGLALPFEVETRVGTMRERFARGSIVTSGEAVLNVMHDRNRPLAREPETLAFEVTEAGLFMRAELPKTREADDAIEMVKKGIWRGISVEFPYGRGTANFQRPGNSCRGGLRRRHRRPGDIQNHKSVGSSCGPGGNPSAAAAVGTLICGHSTKPSSEPKPTTPRQAVNAAEVEALGGTLDAGTLGVAEACMGLWERSLSSAYRGTDGRPSCRTGPAVPGAGGPVPGASRQLYGAYRAGWIGRAVAAVRDLRRSW